MRYWTSDLHIGHGNIITYCDRPFTQSPFVTGYEGEELETDLLVPDVDKMNEALIDNWNDLVDDEDEVWVVGDLALGRLETTVPMAKRLKGKKYLIAGNHDGCHKMHGKYKRFVPLYEDAGFTILDSQVTTTIEGTEILVCHFPYNEISTRSSGVVDRFSGLRPDDDGGWLIHGHTHSEAKVRGRQIHVGVDAHAFSPVSEDWVASVIRNGPK